MKSKRILSLVLAFAMILGTFSFAAAVPNDVVDTEYEDAVGRLELLGILEGYPDGTFRPDNQITRAEFAAVVVRAKGLDGVAKAAKGLPTVFTDVPATHWASGYVGTAAKLGIVNGIGNNLFAPEAPVKYEEAVTMVMRALGYEPAAKAKGGYPFGYLIAASEAGLLNKVKGTQGLPALRGTVAQIADNALEIPMMVQAGYGDQAMYVVSGTANTEIRTLLDEMGFDSIVGIVTKVDEGRNRITVKGEDETLVLTADEDFDFNFADGLTIKAWHSGKDLIVYKALEEAIYGYANKGAKIDVAGTKYSVARGADLEVNGDPVEADEFNADYAKVLLDEDGDIRWAKGYTLPYKLVVAEVEGNVAYDYAKLDANLKDYTILKDGKTISVDDIEELDILLYNRAEKFAIVYNDSEVGEIERVYSDSFRFEGEVYTTDGKYLDGEDFGDLTTDVLDAMMDEEEDVEVYVDTRGNVVLVVGSLGTPVTSSFYGLVTHAKVYDGRRGEMLALDVRNKEGKLVSYDIDKDSDGEYLGLKGIKKGSEGLVNTVVKVTVDKDEDPTAIAKVDGYDVEKDIKLTDSYAGGYKLQDSTIIFYNSGKKAVELGAVENFTKVKYVASGEDATTPRIYVDARDRIVAIVGETDVDEDTEYKTDLVTSVRKLRTGETEFTFFNGDRYTTQAKTGFDKEYKNKIVKLTIGKKLGLVLDDEILTGDLVTVESRSTGLRTIEVEEYDYDLELVSGAKLYDITGRAKEISLIDLKENDKINVYYDTVNKSRFVKFVVRVDDGKVTPPEVKGVVTYIDATGVEVDGVFYSFGAGSVLRNEVGVIEYTGGAAIGGFLQLDDQVFDITANADNRISSFKYVADAADRTAAKTVIDMIDALDPEAATYAADIAAARAAFGTPPGFGTATTTLAQQNLVTNIAKLVAAEDSEAFKTAHATILGKTVGTVVAGDQAALTAAVTAYNAETAASKALLADEKALMDALQAKINELVAAQAQTDAEAFKTAHATILGKTLATVVVADQTALTAAHTTAWGSLSDEAKALLTTEKALLDSLQDRVTAIGAVQTAQTGTAGVSADRAAMKAALEDADLGLNLTAFNALLGAQQNVVLDALLGLTTTYTDTASVQADLDAQL